MTSATVVVLGTGLAVTGTQATAAAATQTTAWHDGSFAVDTAGVVSRSDVVLGRPNVADTQYLPLGNGSLGVAEWAGSGFTAQLNRSDTMPFRESPGQVNIPGLTKMTGAADFTGLLDLYDGVLTESGGGMTLRAWVQANKDELIVDVTGADPGTPQSATISLWPGRNPTAAASGKVGTLAETWVDDSQTGYSGQTFGTLAAITAAGRGVTASVAGSTQVKVSFTPRADGSFRVVAAAPHWAGGDATATATSYLRNDATVPVGTLLGGQAAWWRSYWARSGLIEMNSADGTAQYLENLRTLYLYTEGAAMDGRYPGTQAGVIDMFDFDRDQHDWYPAGTWFWNLRSQIQTNITAGDFTSNIPIFDLYLNALPGMEAWTKAEMGGLPGICVPETMRFNGNGYYNGGNDTQNASCALASSPSYNAETITSGSELSLWIWQQYEATGSISFLRKYYPLMEQSAIFLLAYQQVGSDGLLHAVANAHETQWAVQDSTTDLAADAALFPAVADAARLLHTDSSLISQLAKAETEIPPYARTDAATHTQLLTPAADASGTDVIGLSYQPTAPLRNTENLGLEPVWPYNLIGDDSPLTALADRTYTARTVVDNPDWNFDAIQAARLDLPSQVEQDLVTTTEHYQSFISGMANLFNGNAGDEPYIEQSGEVAATLDEALATDYDGTLRIAPAWPSGWDAAGTVYIQHGGRVDVQIEDGTPATVAIEAGADYTQPVRNPWAGQPAEVVDGRDGRVVVAPTAAGTLSVPVESGHSYLVEPASSPTTSLPFAAVTGTRATTAKHLGNVSIGLSAPVVYPSLAASFDNVAISADDDTAPGDFDGGGASFSETALTDAGAAPGAGITSSGVTFTFPDVAAGTNDNTAAQGQEITLNQSGGTLGFLVSASYGPVTGSGTIIYTDGTTQDYTVTAPDWFSTTPPAGGAVAVGSTYQNRQGDTTYTHSADIFSVPVTLDPGKTVARVQLPLVGPAAAGSPALHVFALGVS